MSKHEEADLILKLYELRREATLRKARDWYFLHFNPESLADIKGALFSENSGYLRMVLTYWDMAAALVNNGAISLELFTETNGEHFSVFAKIEPFLNEARQTLFSPQYLVNLEKLIRATPESQARLEMIRQRIKAVRAEVSARQGKTASAS